MGQILAGRSNSRLSWNPKVGGADAPGGVLKAHQADPENVFVDGPTVEYPWGIIRWCGDPYGKVIMKATTIRLVARAFPVDRYRLSLVLDLLIRLLRHGGTHLRVCTLFKASVVMVVNLMPLAATACVLRRGICRRSGGSGR